MTEAARQPAPKLLDRASIELRTRHHSRRTEEAYVSWIRRFILFHRKRHPNDMGSVEIAAFLSHLAVIGRVSASTQNQALCALLFLYKDVLKRPFGTVERYRSRQERRRRRMRRSREPVIPFARRRRRRVLRCRPSSQ